MRKLIAGFIFILLNFTHLFGQEVILIRHVKVYLEHPGWMSSKKAANYRQAYDASPIHKFNPDTVLAKIPKRNTDTVYVSALSRSVATGLILYGDSANVVSLDMLNEFEMHVIWLPVYLPYKGWTVLSRFMWLLGIKKQGTESYQDAKKRVKQCAGFIEEKTASQKQVIFVTHGFINRNITKELKKRGWKITQNDGKENLGATVLRK